MAKWFVTAKRADFTKIGETFGISPVLARIIRNRDIIEEEEIRKYLQGTIEDMYDPGLLKDMDRTVEILLDKISRRKPIRIIGDYDADGICSTFILHKGLLQAGAAADTAIPHRMKDGYGLNEHLVEDAFQSGIDTIITCDNGIAAEPQIRLAKEKGMTVIVTDHHEVPYEETDGERKYILPPADAVIDPKQEGDAYPYKGICGAVVAYKVMEALYRKLELTQKERPLLEELLEMAAFATVCDVMELLDENRVIVKFGLSHMKNTSNQGLRALMEVNGIDKGKLSAYHIGFVMGPCLNATGRLDTAVRALQLLEEEDRAEAVRIASDLKQLNDSRKEMTERGIKEAAEMIETTSLKEDKVFVIYLPDCHESIAGIIAGKIRDRYYRPTIILTKAEDGVKGSGRSTEEYDMFTELCKCQALFTKFGGHRQAAGVSLKEENVQRFRETINSLCTLTEEDLQMKVYIDMQVPFPYLTEDLIEQFQVMEPFGKGNKRPLFAEKDLKVIQPKIVGKNENVLQCILEDKQGNRMKAVYFGDVKTCLKEMLAGKVTAVTYFPSINEYMGRRSIQLTIVNYQKK